MQFLDAIGLAYFWEKIKDWSNSNFFSKRGGEITPTSGLHYIIDGEQLTVSKSGDENETIDIFTVDENGMEAIKIVRTGGTATQVLMADGSVKSLGLNNGIATLDSNGNVPLAQLGNLDTTVAEVVTALPTTNIKKHIYLIKDTSGVSQNQYEEYIYTGDTSATYDASKWEKLGDFRATVDLADYAKKSETLSNLVWEQRGSDLFLAITMGNGVNVSEAMPTASSSTTGAMSNTDKVKLDGIEAHANNYSLPLATASLRGGIQVGYVANGKNYPVQLSGEKAYVNVPWTDTTYDLSPYAKKNEAVGIIDVNESANAVDFEYKDVNNNTLGYFSLEKASENVAGVMSSADRKKLNGIASGATADSAIPTSVIDALN